MKSNLDELERRAAITVQPGFLDEFVRPALADAGLASPSPDEWETTKILDRGTGRLTLSYRFGDEIVYGKLYSDNLGRHGAELMQTLWDRGFGANGPYRVSQPLAFLSEHNLLLTRAAPGACLLSMVGREDPEFLGFVTNAARWLVRLHRCPLRVGRQESRWSALRLTRVLRRLTKAVARVPEERKRLTSFVKRVCEAGEQGQNPAPVTLTHGRYHNEHIFVAGDTVTLIDLDRVGPADPARDLAEFLTVLRHRTFKRAGRAELADRPTRAFLEEYTAQLPDNTANLTVYWGTYLLLTLLHYVKKRPTEEPAEYDRRMGYYTDELDSILENKWLS